MTDNLTTKIAGLVEQAWQALKDECCADPAKAVRCVMVGEPEFRRALLPILAQVRADARREGMEEAARIAWSHHARIPNHNPDVQRDDLVAQGYGNASLNIATAIRAALKEPNQ